MKKEKMVDADAEEVFKLIPEKEWIGMEFLVRLHEDQAYRDDFFSRLEKAHEKIKRKK
ncbi:MAG: hypothetical protein NWF00_10955 [Candidatus Bathyarchaeota archaeon]|nr:hypothetical protein [Candidatus Bathyarchaeota archaeon]